MIAPSSRYRLSVRYRSFEGDTLGIRPRIILPPGADDQFHTVKKGERLDQLAFRYLGRADLWWLLADINDVFNPLDLAPGLTLRVPSLDRVAMDWLG